ncbi:MAG: ATP-binding cassette domain-containing protein [Rhizobiaceae bacterium]
MLDVKIEGVLGTFVIDVDIHAGKGLTVLYGASGAGKSSILRAIAGLWNPCRGLIKFKQQVLYDSDKNINMPTAQRRLGVVFQEPLLFPHMSVAQNLRYGLRENSQGWGSVIALLDLESLLSRMPRNLSGGEAQRVALGRALLSDPQLLLLDEPLTGLDDARRAQVLPYLEKLRDETKIPILYVSHNRDEILRLADTIFLVESGSAKEKLTLEDFEKRTELPPVPRRDKS